MRKMTNNGLLLCRIQGDLFKNYDAFSKCSPLVFIRRFMNSDLAMRFDDMSVLGEISSNETFVDELNEQYGKTSFGNPLSIDKDVLYWVGYVYRYWSYIYEVPSKQLIMHVWPKMLINRYNLYHSMDIEYLIERICEEEDIQIHPNKTIEEMLEEFCRYLDQQNKK